MTDHTHTTIVEGCFRCELSQDELTDEATLLITLIDEDGVVLLDDLPDPLDRPLGQLENAKERNLQRGLFAGVAVKAYRDRVKGEGDTWTAIVDLLGDLRHLCDATDLDFDTLLESSEVHYDAEVGGEG